mgnify:CR=1 FL=1
MWRRASCPTGSSWYTFRRSAREDDKSALAGEALTDVLMTILVGYYYVRELDDGKLGPREVLLQSLGV